MSDNETISRFVALCKAKGEREREGGEGGEKERECELRLGTGVTPQRHRTAARVHGQLNRSVVKTPVITLSTSPFSSTVAYYAVSLFARDSSYWRGSICVSLASIQRRYARAVLAANTSYVSEQ